MLRQAKQAKRTFEQSAEDKKSLRMRWIPI